MSNFGQGTSDSDYDQKRGFTGEYGGSTESGDRINPGYGGQVSAGYGQGDVDFGNERFLESGQARYGNQGGEVSDQDQGGYGNQGYGRSQGGFGYGGGQGIYENAGYGWNQGGYSETGYGGNQGGYGAQAQGRYGQDRDRGQGDYGYNLGSGAYGRSDVGPGQGQDQGQAQRGGFMQDVRGVYHDFEEVTDSFQGRPNRPQGEQERSGGGFF